jgi:hypothetical protein
MKWHDRLADGVLPFSFLGVLTRKVLYLGQTFNPTALRIAALWVWTSVGIWSSTLVAPSRVPTVLE